jgi:hypothetical protein
MTVFFKSSTPDGLTFTIGCTRCGFEGQVPAESAHFPLKMDGSKDFNCIQLECPQCHAETTHPVTGGSAEYVEGTQQMFAYRYNHDPDEPATNPAEGAESVKRRATEMGEGERYALEGWTPT